jgi:DNA-binding HxlR family transcriptional regulator
VARGLDLVGERWALLVVRELLLGPKRFNDLLAGLPTVSPNVLSQRLRDLVDQGVVARRDLGAPTRVHLYELTDWGRGLEPVLLALGRWGSQAPPAASGVLGIDALLLGLKASFDPTLARAVAGTYELRVDQDVYAMTVGPDGLDLRRGPAARPPDATLTADLDTLRLVCDRRRTIADALRSGDLSLGGKSRGVQRLRELLHQTTGG